MELEQMSRLSGAATADRTGLWRRTDYQAYQILHLGFTAAPILMGLDKFLGLLASWDQYLAPLVPRVTGIPAHTFMMIVGGIEVLVGIGVALKPRIFAPVVAAWLMGIILNLLLIPAYFDVALRDFGLALGALALSRLAIPYDARKQ
jgi:hypothetical protein